MAPFVMAVCAVQGSGLGPVPCSFHGTCWDLLVQEDLKILLSPCSSFYVVGGEKWGQHTSCVASVQVLK